MQKLKQHEGTFRERISKMCRLVMATFALAMGMVGFSVGSAQAWIWDDVKDNMAAAMLNVCGPNDVPTPTTFAGIDSLGGLNKASSDEMRATIIPDWGKDNNGAGLDPKNYSGLNSSGGNGMPRLTAIYSGDSKDIIADPTYERYGFSALRWTSYGHSCFSPGLVMTPIANFALFFMVHLPTMMSMMFLNFVLTSELYVAVSALLSPFISVAYDVFNPWIWLLIPVGAFHVWSKNRGSAQQTIKAAVWGVSMAALFLMFQNSTASVVKQAANVVTTASNGIGCRIAAANTGASYNPDGPQNCDPVQGINEALWSGIPYQTWLVGQVGQEQARLDNQAAKSKGEKMVGWGPAILNGNYVGSTAVESQDGSVNFTIDDKGKQLIGDIARWNTANYNPSSDTGKMTMWAKEHSWDRIPYLANVKVMCNDRASTNTAEEAPDPGIGTRWMYSGSVDESGEENFYCDSAAAGTSSMIPYFTGQEYNNQLIIAVTGWVSSLAVSSTVGVSSTYLGFQKMMFYFLLYMGAPILALSAYGDEKRRALGARYLELLFGNLAKQVLALCTVLFVSRAMAALLSPSNGTYIDSLPWIMKPFSAILFFFCLIFMLIPLKTLVKGAVAGDAKAVDNFMRAPKEGAKKVATVAATTAVTAATLGAGTVAAGGLSAVASSSGAAGGFLAKAGSTATRLGRIASGTSIGKHLRSTGRLMNMGGSVLQAKSTRDGVKAGQDMAAAALVNGPQGAKYERDENGNVTERGMKQARQDAIKMANLVEDSSKAEKAQKAFYEKFSAGAMQAGAMPVASTVSQEEDKKGARQEAIAGELSGASSKHAGSKVQGAVPQYSNKLTPEVQKKLQAEARENLEGVGFARNAGYDVKTSKEAEDMMASSKLTPEAIHKDPSVLLTTPQMYEGGNTTRMDPFHPTTKAMNELRFAAVHGTEEEKLAAVSKAADTIAERGIPNQISGAYAVGEEAKKFNPVKLAATIPHLPENATWQERAAAVQTMRGASVEMPEAYAGRTAVEHYVDMLANPGVPMNQVNLAKDMAISSIIESTDDAGKPIMVAQSDEGRLFGSEAPVTVAAQGEGSLVSAGASVVVQAAKAATVISSDLSTPSQKVSAEASPQEAHASPADSSVSVAQAVPVEPAVSSSATAYSQPSEPSYDSQPVPEGYSSAPVGEGFYDGTVNETVNNNYEQVAPEFVQNSPDLGSPVYAGTYEAPASEMYEQSQPASRQTNAYEESGPAPSEPVISAIPEEPVYSEVQELPVNQASAPDYSEESRVVEATAYNDSAGYGSAQGQQEVKQDSGAVYEESNRENTISNTPNASQQAPAVIHADVNSSDLQEAVREATVVVNVVESAEANVSQEVREAGSTNSPNLGNGLVGALFQSGVSRSEGDIRRVEEVEEQPQLHDDEPVESVSPEEFVPYTPPKRRKKKPRRARFLGDIEENEGE